MIEMVRRFSEEEIIKMQKLEAFNGENENGILFHQEHIILLLTWIMG